MNDQNCRGRLSNACALQRPPLKNIGFGFFRNGGALGSRTRQGIATCKAIGGNGADVFRHACAMGLEGSVLKRLGSTYKAGRSPDWIKTKNPDWKRR